MGSNQSRQIGNSLMGMMNLYPDRPDFRDWNNPYLLENDIGETVPEQLASGNSIDWRDSYDLAPIYQLSPFGDSVACSICSMLQISWNNYNPGSSISRKAIHLAFVEGVYGRKSNGEEIALTMGDRSVSMTLREVLKMVRKVGLLSESECPSPNISQWNVPLTLAMRQKAYHWTIRYQRIPHDNLITVLLQKKTVLTALSIFSNFMHPEVRNSGYILLVLVAILNLRL